MDLFGILARVSHSARNTLSQIEIDFQLFFFCDLIRECNLVPVATGRRDILIFFCKNEEERGKEYTDESMMEKRSFLFRTNIILSLNPLSSDCLAPGRSGGHSWSKGNTVQPMGTCDTLIHCLLHEGDARRRRGPLGILAVVAPAKRRILI